jgi:hypothetical protein
MEKTKIEVIKVLKKILNPSKIKFHLEREDEDFLEFVVCTKPALSFIQVYTIEGFRGYFLDVRTEESPLQASEPNEDYPLQNGLLYYSLQQCQNLDELILKLKDNIGGLLYSVKRIKKIFDKIYNRIDYLIFIFEEEGFEFDDLLTINYDKLNSLKEVKTSNV